MEEHQGQSLQNARGQMQMLPCARLYLMFMRVTAESITVTIKDKERILDGGTSKYLVFTDSEVFENSDAVAYWKFSSSDLHGSLEVGKTYRVRVYGWRIPFFSMYRNIVRIEG